MLSHAQVGHDWFEKLLRLLNAPWRDVGGGSLGVQIKLSLAGFNRREEFSLGGLFLKPIQRRIGRLCTDA